MSIKNEGSKKASILVNDNKGNTIVDAHNRDVNFSVENNVGETELITNSIYGENKNTNNTGNLKVVSAGDKTKVAKENKKTAQINAATLKINTKSLTNSTKSKIKNTMKEADAEYYQKLKKCQKDLLYTKYEGKKIRSEAYTKFVKSLVGSGEELFNTISNAFGIATDTLKAGRTIITKVGENTGKIIDGVGDGCQKFINELGEGVKAITKRTFEGIDKLEDKLIDVGIRVIGKSGEIIEESANIVVETLKAGGAIVNKTGAKAALLVDKTGDLVGEVVAGSTEKLKAHYVNAANTIKGKGADRDADRINARNKKIVDADIGLRTKQQDFNNKLAADNAVVGAVRVKYGTSYLDLPSMAHGAQTEAIKKSMDCLRQTVGDGGRS